MKIRYEPDRFFEKVDFDGEDGCWLWTGSIAGWYCRACARRSALEGYYRRKAREGAQ
jgi:hypothetical protein